MTLKLESGNYLCFQPDTEAQCNAIPIDLYKKASKDYQLKHVKPANTQLAAYGGSKQRVVGQVRIRVWRGDYKCQLHACSQQRNSSSNGHKGVCAYENHTLCR